MALSAGFRLGPYEVVDAIGAGGMGEVYRARDTRLDRIVAIKILPQSMAARADLRERFEREARATSSLNHPHICALYDVGHQDGVHFLVMEYVAGETLAARLARGPLPLDQALRFAIQVADALDKAHRRGVVHRDLKPGNIMLTSTGAKLLDFGLARLTGPDSGKAFPGLSQLPTQTGGLTAEGNIVGTLLYMPPEQLEGKEADARSDIFAFGTVLHEAVTGRRAFEANSQAAVIAAILNSEPPPVSSLQPIAPKSLDRLVKKCLAKEPDARWQNAHDLATALEWIAEGDGPIAAAAHERPAHRARERIAWLIAAIAVAGAGAAAALLLTPTEKHASATTGAVRFTVEPPEGTQLRGGIFAAARLSPDGRKMIVCAALPNDRGRLYLRWLDRLQIDRIPGTDAAEDAIWSPDSRTIAFVSEGMLKRVEVSGGPPQTICPVTGNWSGGAWGPDGTIVFGLWGQAGQSAWYRVSASGGSPEKLHLKDASGVEVPGFHPRFLPDGDRFVFSISALYTGGPTAGVASLTTGRVTPIASATSFVEYAPPGHLLFVREGTLLAQPFDMGTLRLMGEAVPVAESVPLFAPTASAEFSVSQAGVLAYVSAEQLSRLVWRDRTGRELGTVGEAGGHMNLRLSHDGRSVVEELLEPRYGTTDLMVHDLVRGISTRLTFDPSGEGTPVWSPDDREVLFQSDVDAPPHLFIKALDGAEAKVLVPSKGNLQMASDWSADGRFIAYTEWHPTSGGDLWIVPMTGERKPVPFLSTPFNEYDARFSPDGRWIAFVSEEDVYVQPFPGPGARRRVSTRGGSNPRWRGDGKELFYLANEREVMAVPVTSTGTAFESGEPRILFRSEATGPFSYDATPDGQRFLVTESIGSSWAPPITVVLDWTASLKR